MSKLLHSLTTKLAWQLNELSHNLHLIEEDILFLKQQLDNSRQKISSTCTIPAFILPEQEMARVHFVRQQLQQQDELKTKKAALLAEKNTLTSQLTRLKTELKMLEKYQEAKHKIQQQHILLTQQNNSDEWVLQRRGHQ